jgi:glycosyltransferase involved in cell wall biosynthesis
MGQYAAMLSQCPAPRILVEHEPGEMATPALRPSGVFARLLRAADRVAWSRYERGVLRRVRAVVAFTEADRLALARLAGRTPIVRIPLGTTLPAEPLDPRGRAPWRILFVGNFIHPPNVDAALRLARSIVPQLRQRYPHLVLWLVGPQPPPELVRLSSESVVVTGRVPDVTPYLDEAALVVVPLRLGGGMRVKVLEALAAGKAIIASPVAVAGLAVTDGEQVILAETDEQFVASVAHLLDNVEERVALAARARRWAVANLGWQRPVEAYERLYGAVLAGEPVAGGSGNLRLDPGEDQGGE